MTAGFREFEFNLPDALLSSLVTAFDVMESGPLALENASQLPEAQGVYQLIYEDGWRGGIEAAVDAPRIDRAGSLQP
jgi:hypothetical protein